MDWGDATVMGGDLPLAIKGRIEEYLGVGEIDLRKPNPEAREKINGDPQGYKRFLISLDAEYEEIAVQVGGVVILATGATLTKDTKALIIERREVCAHVKQWSSSGITVRI